MNRYKAEQKRKYEEARKGLTKEQIAALDFEDDKKKKIDELARKIHIEKFPEEYDYMHDSSWDISDRNKGINPMSQDYIDKIRKKRDALGVYQLSESGMPVSNDTMLLCIDEAQKIINGQ